MLYLSPNSNRSVAAFITQVLKPLTDTQSEVKDAEPNVEPEEEDDVGHFTEQEHVAYVLLQCDWGKGEKKKWSRHITFSLLIEGQKKAGLQCNVYTTEPRF